MNESQQQQQDLLVLTDRDLQSFPYNFTPQSVKNFLLFLIFL